MQIAYPKGFINQFWEESFFLFFRKNNIKVNTSPLSHDDLFKLGKSFLNDEFCLPVKLFAGHVRYCAENFDDPVFIPFLSGNKARDSFLCPLSIRICDILINSGVLERGKLLSPSFQFSDNFQLSFIERHYPGDSLNIPFDSFSHNFPPDESIEVSGSHQPRILITGRHYILNDPWLNRFIPDRISRLGMVPLLSSDSKISSEEKKLADYSHFSFSAAQLIYCEELAKQNRIDGIVVLKSFLCGPDCAHETDLERFLPPHFNKPILELVLDETRSEEGFQTRLEAFADMVFKIRESA